MLARMTDISWTEMSVSATVASSVVGTSIADEAWK